MPYRILARNSKGNTVTRVDMNPGAEPPTDPQLAQQIADEFALKQVHQGPWRGLIEYYEGTIANHNPYNDPLWGKKVKVKAKNR